MEGKTRTSTIDISASSIAYRHIEQLMFDASEITNTFMQYTGKGEIKFRTALRNVSREELEEEYKQLYKFLNARTSTVSGVKRVSENQYKKYTEKTGSDISFETFSQAYSEGLLLHYKEIYGSDELVRLLDEQGDLELREIIYVLRLAGFNENTTDENAPTLDSIYNEFEEYKKKMPEDEDEEIL